MHILFRTLAYLKPYKLHAFGNIVSNILATFFTIISFVVLKPFLDILFLQKYDSISTDNGFLGQFIGMFNNFLVEYIQQYGQHRALGLICGTILVLFFCKNLFRYLALYIMSPVRNGIERDLRQSIFSKLVQMPISYFSEERKGDLLARFGVDVHEIQWSVLRSLETIVRAPVAILGSLAVMMYISPMLTLFSFVLILVVGGIIGQIGKLLRRSSSKAQETLGNLMSIVEETLGGIRIIHAFNAENHQQHYFGTQNTSYFQLQNSIQRRRDLSSPLTEFLGIGIVGILLLFGGNLVFSGHFEASTFVVFVMMFYNIIEPAKSFASAFYDMQKGSAAAARIDEILKTVSTQKIDLNAPAVNTIRDSIEYRNVSFQYPNKQDLVLDKISWKIPFGKTIAIVGTSGAGKSTLVDLLPRFYDATEGEILVDGIDIQHLKLDSWRNLIGLVSQEPILFNDTIYNNIVLGFENATAAEVERAARLANAHDFIAATEQGYQTNIGDRGMKLSGGQRQRLTLARAILRNPPILILDEATSALDSESERLIQEALANLRQNRIVIIIAHRFSTIQFADEIVVLDNGKIVEQGTHETLVQLNGIYTRLYGLQQL